MSPLQPASAVPSSPTSGPACLPAPLLRGKGGAAAARGGRVRVVVHYKRGAHQVRLKVNHRSAEELE